MDKVLNMTYASSLTELCEINSSFDTGILRICYTGENRNGSSISKEAIIRSLKTIYNCPIVCNYDRETNTLGGHDIEIFRDEDGSLKMVNMTTPVGVVPESARIWFADYEEDDGTINEYLYSEVLLWKRQEAYEKIKEDGITSHSMEITVNSGKTKDGVYHIDDFEFTAFALIGVEPCFESSALEVFSKQEFKQQFAEMMQEIKESFKSVNTSTEVDNKHPQNNSMEGGERILEEKMNLSVEYGIDVDSLDFSIDDFSIEELTEKFEAIKAANIGDSVSEPVTEPTTEPVSEPTTLDTGKDNASFALTGNLVDEMHRVLGEVKIQREWGECPRYYYVDCDMDLCEVYCWDANDWLLYGFSYTVDGDSINIDFETKKRKKYVIADFDEGDQPSPFASVFAILEQKVQNGTEWESKYNNASATIASMETELGELREFKSGVEANIAKEQRDAILGKFTDLQGVEAYEDLCNNSAEYDLETLEEKCYAIRGRQGVSAKFSAEPTGVKLPVDKNDVTKDPYGGIVEKYLGKH